MTQRLEEAKPAGGPSRSAFPFLDSLEERRFTLHAFVLIAVLVSAAYANSLYSGFVYDDVSIVKRNELITRLDNIPALFVSEYWESMRDPNEAFPLTFGLYRPLVMATYSLNYAVGGVEPWGYHLVNVVLHLAVTWVLFLVALQVGFSRTASFIAASLFAVHPIHVEAVTGIVGRAELLMALSVLLGLRWAIRNRMALSSAAFLAGIFSKEQALVLPGIVLLYDFCRGSLSAANLSWKRWQDWLGLVRRLMTRHVGYVVALGMYLVVRYFAMPLVMFPTGTQFLSNPLVEADGYSRILTAVKVAWRYLWLCLWPARLSGDYSFNSVPVAYSVTEPEVLLGLLAWGGLFLLAVRSWRGDRKILFAVGLTVLPFLPTSNLFTLVAIMAERFFYLPSAGLCLLAGLGFESLAVRAVAWSQGLPRKSQSVTRRERAGLPLAVRLGTPALLSVICLALTARTVVRNRDWESTETLFASIRRDYPENVKPYVYFGTLAAEKGDLNEAFELFHKALQIYPHLAARNLGFNRRYGKLLMDTGKLEESLPYLERAASLQPRISVSYYNLGLVYGRLGRYRESEAALKKSLELNSENPDAYNTLSRLYIELGRWEQAIAAAGEAIQRRPEHVWAHFNRAWALEKTGRAAEALADYEKAHALDSETPEIKKKVDDLRASLRKAAG